MSRPIPEKKLGAGRVVAVAIENNKTSQSAAKWAVDNLLPKDQSLLLIHVKQIADWNEDVAQACNQEVDNESKELFASFRAFFNRKNIHCKEVLLGDTDICKALIESVSTYSIELLVLGAPSRSGLVRRFRVTDVPSSVLKGAPPFCTVYVISKGKISTTRSATAPLPLPDRMDAQAQLPHDQVLPPPAERPAYGNVTRQESDKDDFRSPFTRGSNAKSYESSILDSDISFVNGGGPSMNRMFPSFYDDMEPEMTPCPSAASDFDVRNYVSFSSASKSNHVVDDLSVSSQENDMSSVNTDDVEAEMRRLKLELKQTKEMYSTARKEAFTAKQKAMELQRWKLDELKKLEEAKIAEEAALLIAEKEKAKCTAALEAAEASKKLAELEAQKRKSAEIKARKDIERKKSLDTFSQGGARYRRYSIEELEEATQCFSESLKIGEGGYGPVYRCQLDHTAVAVKVLRPDAAQGRSQFKQEVEVLSCIRHPNMVLLLGACPEYGCLVYEYMANGSLEDCLFRKGNTPVLPWQLRFIIAAEIGTALLFLHQTKPEPIVHRDLKPGNILLDRNYVSKISDVGLARLVPPSVADTVTQYRMTSTAGTFCYIDPEYQQTGMLGIKSDIYSLGIMYLQLITAKSPMALTHHVARAIEKGTFREMLDPAVEDWPVEQSLQFATLALQCAEMRKKDRPDLGTVVLPQLNKLRAFAEDNIVPFMVFGKTTRSTPRTNAISSNSNFN
ncbi:U-box domain-containing protein 35 [Senna tora]|uniref:RING-type E3 ubiquitin transferase n=1 Tax=Senna tora TaxID=362788 RepID=A0A834WCB7_9FABA|nr:U-box domain-containing protein 35 [Senna tora]